jgi:hypothetical protein
MNIELPAIQFKWSLGFGILNCMQCTVQFGPLFMALYSNCLRYCTVSGQRVISKLTALQFIALGVIFYIVWSAIYAKCDILNPLVDHTFF